MVGREAEDVVDARVPGDGGDPGSRGPYLDDRGLRLDERTREQLRVGLADQAETLGLLDEMGELLAVVDRGQLVARGDPAQPYERVADPVEDADQRPYDLDHGPEGRREQH